MYKEVRYLPEGDSGLLMEFSDAIEPETNARIRTLLDHLEKEGLEPMGIVEVIPTYRSILFLYDPLKTDFKALTRALKEKEKGGPEKTQTLFRQLTLPVLYGGEEGPDLPFVAEHAGRTIEEVIHIHTAPDYLVYMLGFTPGFTYLGGLDPRIFTPRLKTARIRIPAGSVGIADKQTGIYPIDSPGGWQLIGKTPLALYTPKTDPPVLLRAGDHIKFEAIDKDQYDEIREKVQKGTYQVISEMKEASHE